MRAFPGLSSFLPMLIGLSVSACAFCGSLARADAASESNASTFQWCRPLNHMSNENLEASKVPTYPIDFAARGHENIDGRWVLHRSLKDVWHVYSQTPLKKVWRSLLVRYRFTSEPEWHGLHEGLRFFLDIDGDGMGLICEMGMGVQVTRVVYERSIQFEYLDFSPAYGVQVIQFRALGPEETEVVHKTKYIGKDPVIDSLYPAFHREAIEKLHAAARLRLKQTPRSTD